MAELVCGTADRGAWLAARREGITATDIAVIMGLVAWDSPFALYWRKKGTLPEVEASDRMRLGSWLEGRISDEWSEREGKLLEPGGLFRSGERPWQLATPDYRVADLQSVYAVLECKTSGTRDGWGEDGGSAVPAHVRAQVLWQMDTLDVAAGHVAVVFLPSGEFRSYTIRHAADYPHDDIALGPDAPCLACRDIALMRHQGHNFWDRLQENEPPPVDGSPPTTDALRFLHAGVVKGKRAEIENDSLELQWEHWAAQLKEAQAAKRAVENAVRDQMGDAQYAVAHGQVFARREVYKNPGYTVSPFEVDRLVRVKPKETDSE